VDRSLKLLVVLLLLAMPACSDRDDAISLQVFGDGAEITGYRELIAAFERDHPDVRVRLIAVPSQGDHTAKLATGFSGGTPPDLFLINYRRYGQFAGKGVLEPLGRHLGDDLSLDDFYPQALEAFRANDEQICLPQNISNLVVYWNRALFRSAGADEPRAGWTWSDFLAAAKKITRDTDGDGKTDVYGVATEPNLIRLAPFVWQAGGDVVDSTDAPTRTTLLDAASLRAIKFFIELRRVHKVAPSLQEAESQELEDRFAHGTLGMILDSRRFTPALRAVEGLDWDVAPLPRQSEAATILHSDAYCMAKASTRKQAAAAFVRFALSAEGASIVARSGRTVPSVRAVAQSTAFLDPTKRPASAQVFLDQIPLIRRVPSIETWNEIETKADPIIEEWYYGTERIEALGIEIDLATRELFGEGS